MSVLHKLLLVLPLLYPFRVMAADPKAGATKAGSCAACHMVTGCSVNPIWPKLANQHEFYLAKQLKDMKSGKRKVPEMMAFLANLSEKDLEDIAAHFAGLPPCPKI